MLGESTIPGVAALYLKQLLAGRDFGVRDQVATAMQNFVYLVGDADARQCYVVDPAWDIGGILDVAAADDMQVVGALVTHYHPDHVGGSMMGLSIEGLASLMDRNPCKVHVHKAEADGVSFVTGLDKSDLVLHESNDRVKVGDIEIELLHTPGHTPGSQCFLVEESGRPGRLVSGDTLFLGSCGRVDLPGSDPEAMYRSLNETLKRLPDDTLLYPGHLYASQPWDTLGNEKRTNPFLRVAGLEQFLMFLGA
jgi:glyoxylase-like metal-dependent hydrolase (beta-lactamase superfamily II)